MKLEATDKRKITLGSLFDGAGGFPLAASRHGIVPVWASEIAEKSIAVTKRHFPDMTHLGDVVGISGASIPPVDIISFGSPCFPAGTLVLAERGYVPIEKLQVGEKVLTHCGRWRKILRTGNTVSETVVLKGFGHFGLETTPEHPIYSISRNKIWNNERQSYETFFGVPEWTDAANMKGKMWGSVVEVEALPVPHIEKLNCRCNEPPKMDVDFWWMVGQWLANGWIRDGQRSGRPVGETWGQLFICCAYGKANETLNRLRNVSGLKWVKIAERTVMKFRTNNKSLVRWMNEHFGKKAHGKRIPSWVLTLPQEYRQALVEGYLADGWLNGASSQWSITSVSKQLALGVKAILATLGKAVALYHIPKPKNHVIEGRVVNQRDLYMLRYYDEKKTPSCIESDKYIWGTVKNVSSTGETKRVYNLEVDEDNSYVVENIIVHNCQDFSIAGKRAGMKRCTNESCKEVEIGLNEKQCPMCGAPVEATRSGLFGEAIRIIDEMREASDGKYPQWAVFENVPRTLSSGRPKGSDFQAIIEAFTKARVPMPQSGRWADAGLVGGFGVTVAWRMYDAAGWGIPQRRKRLFLVASYGEICPSEILFIENGMFGDIEPSREKGAASAFSLGEGVASADQRQLSLADILRG